MKKILCILVASLTFLPIVSQNKDKVNIYLNDDFETIEKSDFYRKKQSYLYHEKIKQTDSATLHILRLTTKFGKIEDRLLIQVKNILENDYKFSFKPNETLIINYTDTLYGYNTQKKYKKPNRVYKMTKGDTVEIRTTKKRFEKIRRTIDDSRKKCPKKNAKINVSSIYLYNTKFEDSYDYKNVSWQKINTVFIDLFFKNRSGIIYIKPNGQYFKYGWEISEKKIEGMLKMEDWDWLIEEYQVALTLLPEKPIGYFKQIQPKILKRRPNQRRRRYSLSLNPNSSKKRIRKQYELYINSLPIRISCRGLSFNAIPYN